MKPEELREHFDKLRVRRGELEKRLADPDIYKRRDECREVTREHQRLKSLFEDLDTWAGSLKELDENRTLAEEDDGEIRQMALAEIERLERITEKAEKKVRIHLLPPDRNESKNIIVNVKPAAGGDEAGLFAAELVRAYLKYAEQREWKVEILEHNESGIGGIKEVLFSMSGDDAYTRMKYESGVHRVQRVPQTESGGRIHTSTVTVSVLPEAEDVELEINNEDLRIDVYRSSGPGGQSVNTTDSAVRVTHIPSGLVVTSQQEKSQHRNKDLALRVLRARLLEIQEREEALKQAADKKSQVGSGDRSERIRTYNFPQNRITDHRFNISVYDLPKLLEGDFDPLIDEIMSVDSERRIAELNG